MSDSLFSVEIDDSAVMARLRAMSSAVRDSLERAVWGLAIDIQGKVQAKLAGPVLNERTHHLHDSIHPEVTPDAHGVVGKVGTNVKYAAFWEYGFTGTEQVKEHLRMMTQAFGHPVATPHEILVRAHARKIDQPARSYLRSTLSEEADHIRDTLEGAVKGALQ